LPGVRSAFTELRYLCKGIICSTFKTITMKAIAKKLMARNAKLGYIIALADIFICFIW
jgi:hypothetical protein